MEGSDELRIVRLPPSVNFRNTDYSGTDLRVICGPLSDKGIGAKVNGVGGKRKHVAHDNEGMFL